MFGFFCCCLDAVSDAEQSHEACVKLLKEEKKAHQKTKDELRRRSEFVVVCGHEHVRCVRIQLVDGVLAVVAAGSRWSNGEKYFGEWNDGQKHGYGVFKWPGGAKHKGGWKDGMAHGHGVHTWPDGEKHDGEYKDGKKHGQGVHTWPDGSNYVGEYKDGKKHGHGVLAWYDGRKYVGMYQNDKMHGDGVLTWPDGRKYFGPMEDDSMTDGVFTWPNGSTGVPECPACFPPGGGGCLGNQLAHYGTGGRWAGWCMGEESDSPY